MTTQQRQFCVGDIYYRYATTIHENDFMSIPIIARVQKVCAKTVVFEFLEYTLNSDQGYMPMIPYKTIEILPAGYGDYVKTRRVNKAEYEYNRRDVSTVYINNIFHGGEFKLMSSWRQVR